MTQAQIEYKARMREARQFRYFGLEPQWRPDAGDIDGFVHDEVVRQFHDTSVDDDGGKRVRWMRAAWDYALENRDRTPDLQDVIKLGMLVEPGLNRESGFRIVNVSIAGRLGAPPTFLNRFMSVLCGALARVTTDPLAQFVVRNGQERMYDGWTWENFESYVPLLETAGDWYLAFQFLHPFTDGNGRTGKILHNWLSGGLEDPYLIPDYFGGGNP